MARVRTRRGRQRCRISDRADSAASDAGREFGIIDLIEEFTALRHEVKLQTKSSRGLSGQTDTTLAALEQAIDHFRSVEPKEAQAAWTAGKALALGLADLDEALDRGQLEIERARQQIADLSAPASKPLCTSSIAAGRGFAAGCCGSITTRSSNRSARRRSPPRPLRVFLRGYGLIRKRLRRVIAAEGVVAIPCEGRAGRSRAHDRSRSRRLARTSSRDGVKELQARLYLAGPCDTLRGSAGGAIRLDPARGGQLPSGLPSQRRRSEQGRRPRSRKRPPRQQVTRDTRNRSQGNGFTDDHRNRPGHDQ